MPRPERKGDENQPGKGWPDTGNYPIMVIITVLGGMIGIVPWITSTLFFRRLLRAFSDPDEVASLVNLWTIIGGTLALLLYILIRQTRSRARKAKMRRYGYSGICLFWVIALFVVFRSAPLAEPASAAGPVAEATAPVGGMSQQPSGLPTPPAAGSTQLAAGSTPPASIAERVENDARVRRLPEIPSVSSPIEFARGWVSIAYLQNIGNAPAAVDYHFEFTSDQLSLQKDGVNRGETWVIDHAKVPGLPAGITGGAVVSSDQPMYAVVIMRGSRLFEQGPTLRLAYIGVTASSEKMYFPPVKNNYYGVSSGYHIQNISSTSSQFLARFVFDDGKEYQFLSPVLKDGESYWLDLEDAKIEQANEQQGRLGSLIVESDKPLTAVIYEYKTGDNKAVYAYMNALSSADGYTSAYIPERGLGGVINLHIVNVDSVPIEVEVSYGAGGRGAGCQGGEERIPKQMLKPDAAISILQDNLSQDMNCRPWARIDGSGRFIAYASEANSDQSGITSLSYPARAVDRLTRKLAVPIFADHHDGVNSRFDIRSSSAFATTTITATFYCTDAQEQKFILQTKPLKIEPAGAFVFQDLGTMLGYFEDAREYRSNAWCSVLVEGSQPIVGYVTEMPDGIQVTTRVNFDAMNIPE